VELSVREAAVVLGRSPRTVRAQLIRGDLPGVKRDGRWRIPKDALPLTERQRRALAAKADSIRAAVDAALPSRAATTPRSRIPCIDDSEAFRVGCDLLLRFREDVLLCDGVRGRVEGALQEAAVAVHQYDPSLKLAALNRARRLLAEAAALLVLASTRQPAATEPRVPGGLQLAIETELLPVVSRAARRADRLQSRRDRDEPPRRRA
jgi:excisionase family DNA binding protein